MVWPYQIHAEQAQQAIGNWPAKKAIPGWLVEKLHNEKVTGGYNKRNKLCPTCFTKASNTGICLC